jgi:iron complex outermembrane receptor protein
MYASKVSRLILGAGLALAVGMPAVQAQVLEEIIVTARKTSENLQDSPAVITAFSEDTLESIGVTSMRDYAQLVPNMFVVETQNSSFTFVNIRGISQMRNTDPSVAVVIDGVQQTNAIGMSQELYDIQQIEVLKGPQGALYGRNSIGGAINITTKRPGDEVEGFVRVGAGNGESYKVQGAVGGPLIEDKLYGRAALSYSDSEGVRNNITTGGKSDSRKSLSFRGRIIWEASEDLEVDLRASVSQDEGTALQFADSAAVWAPFGPNPNVSLGCGVGIFPAASPQCLAGPVQFGENKVIENPNNPAAGIFQGDINNTNREIETSVNGVDERDLYNFSALLTWDLGMGTLISATSYDEATNAARGEQPPRTPTLAFLNSQWRDTKTWSQEIRFNSPDEQPIRWSVGAYYLDTDAFLSTTVQRNSRGIDSLDTFIRDDPLPSRCNLSAGFPFPGSAGDSPTDCVLGYDGDQQNNTAWAVFAQASFDLSDNLELTVSARYDEDSRKQTLATPDAFLSFFCDINNNGNCSDSVDLQFGDVNSADFDSFQPKATLKWTTSENLMAYATYSEGFRSGGYNRPGIGNRADSNRGFFPPGFIPQGINDVYPQQDLTSVEGGFKWTSTDGRFLFNGSAFYSKVDDYQTFTFNGQLNGSQIIIPVDEVELHGIEIDAAAVLTDNLSANLGFGWTDSEITEDTSRGALTLGNNAPQTPDTTLNLGLQYNQTLSSIENGEAFLRVDYQRIGELFFMPANWVARDPLNLVNLRGGLAFGDGWRVEGWVRNLTDENYFAEGFNDAGGLFFFGKLRTYGLEVTKRF